jgi:hypothetical protein
MKTVNQTCLDFDYLIELAQTNPSEFEQLRVSAIESYISTLPAERQQKMRRLQWRIDQERRNHTPMGACVKLSKMMWDTLLSPGGLARLLPADWREESHKGQIIPFPTPQ